MRWLRLVILILCLSVVIGNGIVLGAYEPGNTVTNLPATTDHTPSQDDDNKNNATNATDVNKNTHKDIGSDVHLTADYIKLANPSLTDNFEALAEYIFDECKARGINDVTTVLALIETESNWINKDAEDGFGTGLGQLSWKVVGEHGEIVYLTNSDYRHDYDLSGRSDLYKIKENIHGTIFKWNRCLKLANGDPYWAYCHYNAGEGNTEAYFKKSKATIHADRYISIYSRLKTGDPNMIKGGKSAKIVWMLDGLNKLGNILKKAIDLYAKKALLAFDLVMNLAVGILVYLITIDFLVFMIFSFGNFNLQVFVAKIIKYGFCVFFLTSYKFILMKGLLGLLKIVASAFSEKADVITALRDPGQLVQHFIYVIMPIFNKLSDYNAYDYITSFGLVMLTYLLAFITLLFIAYVFLKITMWFLEFYFISAMSVISIPFIPLKITKFLPEGMIGAAISSGLKLIILTAVLGIILDPLTNIQPITFSNTIELFAFVVKICILVYLLIGIPNRIMKHWGGSIEI